MSEALRQLPQVDQLLRDVVELEILGPVVARWLVRREVDAARARIIAGDDAGDLRAIVADRARELTDRRLRRVVNATGVVLHTNLGRAPLSEAAIAAVIDAARATPVELDMRTGERGARAPVAATLAAALCDAQAALVVNNNAAALLLALSALASGGEVLVSRGELVEIGGGFRLPEVMQASGAMLREVGTTNRTRADDYRRAVGDRTALILKVHPSNFRVEGFVEEAPVDELAEVARDAGVPLLFDTGSGVLRPTDGIFAGEPDAATALAAGADLVCFSGDKLLGGPQAGVLAGDAELVERCRKHPIARAVRADKLTLAAMEATLWEQATGASSPVAAMFETDADALRARAERIAAAAERAHVVELESVSGGGALPGVALPSVGLAVDHDRPERFAAALRARALPIVARVERGRVVLDLRTVDPTDDDAVRDALR